MIAAHRHDLYWFVIYWAKATGAVGSQPSYCVWLVPGTHAEDPMKKI